MAYQDIPDSDYEVGKPVKKEILQKADKSLEDHESRLNAVETAVSQVVLINNTFVGIDQLKSSSAVEGLALFEATRALTLTSCVLTTYDSATSGTLEVDVQLSDTTDPTGTYSTVFTVRPSIAFGASPGSSSNAAFSTTSIPAGRWLRVDLTSFLDPSKSFHLKLLSEVA